MDFIFCSKNDCRKGGEDYQHASVQGILIQHNLLRNLLENKLHTTTMTQETSIQGLEVSNKYAGIHRTKAK